jgi:hypothetical protein
MPVKKILFAVAMAAAIVAPSAAFAADDAMSMAPMICRPVKSGETANATMGSAGMMCRKVDMAKVKAAMTKMHSAMSAMEGSTMTADQKKAHADLSSAMASMSTLYGFGGG